MNKAITILDKDYIQWVQELSKRYQQNQIKAAVKVNEQMLHFYWTLGKDIVEMHIEERWGEKVINNLSIDLQNEIPNATGFSRRNIYYCKQYYLLYYQMFESVPQLGAQSEGIKKRDCLNKKN